MIKSTIWVRNMKNDQKRQKETRSYGNGCHEKSCMNIVLRKNKKGSEKKNEYQGRNHKRGYQEKTTDLII